MPQMTVVLQMRPHELVEEFADAQPAHTGSLGFDANLAPPVRLRRLEIDGDADVREEGDERDAVCGDTRAPWAVAGLLVLEDGASPHDLRAPDFVSVHPVESSAVAGGADGYRDAGGPDERHHVFRFEVRLLTDAEEGRFAAGG